MGFTPVCMLLVHRCKSIDLSNFDTQHLHCMACVKRLAFPVIAEVQVDVEEDRRDHIPELPFLRTAHAMLVTGVVGKILLCGSRPAPRSLRQHGL